MYINDIAEGVTSQMRMFADNGIAYRQIHTPADHFTLASDLNKRIYHMGFNFTGSQQMQRTNNRDYLGLLSK